MLRNTSLKYLTLLFITMISVGASPSGSEIKNLAANAGDLVLIPGSGRTPGGGHGNPPIFLPGESHGQRNLAGYSPSGRKESDTTEATERSTQHILSVFKSLSNNPRSKQIFLKVHSCRIADTLTLGLSLTLPLMHACMHLKNIWSA